jgi:hypothetical protein
MSTSQRSRSPEDDDADDQSQVEDGEGKKQINRACDFCHRMKMKCIGQSTAWKLHANRIGGSGTDRAGKENPPCRRCKQGGHTCTFNGPRKSKSTRVEESVADDAQCGILMLVASNLSKVRWGRCKAPFRSFSNCSELLCRRLSTQLRLLLLLSNLIVSRDLHYIAKSARADTAPSAANLCPERVPAHYANDVRPADPLQPKSTFIRPVKYPSNANNPSVATIHSPSDSDPDPTRLTLQTALCTFGRRRGRDRSHD